jgi:hypothetical protein
MTNEARWQQYLYSTHPQAEIRLWARQLKYFRFCKAYGGHANDGDQLKVALKFDSEEDLVETCKSLGLPLRRISADSPKPVPGVRYSWQEFTKFVSFVDDFPTIEQPGWTTLLGLKVHVWIRSDRLEICIMDEGNLYEVSAAAVDVASKIEELLRPLAERLIEPPQDNRNCICPKFYPEFWDE